jgi:hypothetical protein
MTKSHRMLFEVAAPPLLAAFFIDVKSVFSVSSWIDLGMIFGGFIPLIFMLYLIGIIPSLIYMGLMEFWFRMGMHRCCGLFCTVILSAVLGWGAALLSGLILVWMGFLFMPDILAFSWFGILVGLLIGFYVGKRQVRSA